mmetsp:Transcript_4732/g.12318  ORF Transcript_4732/g.12318 Transcript_4732/m.12318 type:complete len:261 (+) Transcript_4732:512-1294(+)
MTRIREQEAVVEEEVVVRARVAVRKEKLVALRDGGSRHDVDDVVALALTPLLGERNVLRSPSVVEHIHRGDHQPRASRSCAQSSAQNARYCPPPCIRVEARIASRGVIHQLVELAHGTSGVREPVVKQGCNTLGVGEHASHVFKLRVQSVDIWRPLALPSSCTFHEQEVRESHGPRHTVSSRPVRRTCARLVDGGCKRHAEQACVSCGVSLCRHASHGRVSHCAVFDRQRDAECAPESLVSFVCVVEPDVEIAPPRFYRS